MAIGASWPFSNPVCSRGHSKGAYAVCPERRLAQLGSFKRVPLVELNSAPPASSSSLTAQCHLQGNPTLYHLMSDLALLRSRKPKTRAPRCPFSLWIIKKEGVFPRLVHSISFLLAIKWHLVKHTFIIPVRFACESKFRRTLPAINLYTSALLPDTQH